MYLFILLSIFFLLTDINSRADDFIIDQYRDGNLIKNGDASNSRIGWSSYKGYTSIVALPETEGVVPKKGSKMFGPWYYDGPVEKMKMSQTIYLKGDYKLLSEDGQLRLGGRTFYYNNDEGDYGWMTVYAYKKGTYMGYYSTRRLIDGSWTKEYINRYRAAGSSEIKVFKYPRDKDYFYNFNGSWAGVDKLVVVIEGYRDPTGGKDCDVYFDDIVVSLTDIEQPRVLDIQAVAIDNISKKELPDKKFLKVGDKVAFKVKFNEHVDLSNASLKLNIANRGEKVIAKPDLSLGRKLKEAQFYYVIKEGDEVGSEVDMGLSGSSAFGGIVDLAYAGIGDSSKYAHVLKSVPNFREYNKNFDLKLDTTKPVFNFPISKELKVYNEYKGIQGSKEWILESSPWTLWYTTVMTKSEEIQWDKAYKINSSEVANTFNMDLEMDGRNQGYLAIKIMDEAGNELKKYYLINQQDTTGPTLEVKQIGQGDGSQYRPSIKLEIHVTDLESRLKTVKYQIGDKETPLFQVEEAKNYKRVYTTILDLPKDLKGFDKEEIEIKVMGVDGKGNTSHQNVNVNLDRSPPEIAEVIYDSMANTLSWRVKDKKNGVQEVKYALLEAEQGVPSLSSIGNGDSPWKSIITNEVGKYSIDISYLRQGKHKLYLWAKDTVGNQHDKETITIKVFEIDAQGPQIKLIKTQQLPQQPQAKMKIEFEIRDDHLPLILCQYQFSKKQQLTNEDEDGWQQVTGGEILKGVYTGRVDLDQENIQGIYYLHLRAEDALGNRTTVNILKDNPILMDRRKPSIQLIQGINQEYKKGHEVLFQVQDISGIIKSTYALTRQKEDKPTTWQETSLRDGIYHITIGKDQVLEDGLWYLHIQVIDQCGNEKLVTLEEPFKLDFTKPKGRLLFGEREGIEETFKKSVTLQMIVEEEPRIEEIQYELQIVEEEKAAKEIDWLGEWKKYKANVKVELKEGRSYAYVRYRDGQGNISDTMTANIKADYTPPQVLGTNRWKETEQGNSPVTVELELEDQSTVLNTLGGEPRYRFRDNGTFTFVIRDLAGNLKSVPVTVKDIRSQPAPKAKLASDLPLDTWTNKDVTVSIELEESVGWNFISEGGSRYRFTENATHQFLYEDGAGNQGMKTVTVTNIDKKPPTAQVRYAKDPKSPLVTAYMIPSEGVEITNNGGSPQYIFTKSGSFTFQFVDKAGNTGSVTATVSAFDILETPGFNIQYSEGSWTKEAIEATLSIPEGWRYKPVTSLQPNVRVISTTDQVLRLQFEDNGMANVEVIKEGDPTQTRILMPYVENIDRVAPFYNQVQSTADLTNDDVEVALLGEDNRSLMNTTQGALKLLFKENGEESLTIKDVAGNETKALLTCYNIRKGSPKVELQYLDEILPEEFGNKQVLVTLVSKDNTPLRILNNNGNDSYIFYDNGSFEFQYEDEIGNRGSVVATVDSIISRLPDVYLSYEVNGQIYSKEEFENLPVIRDPVKVVFDFEFLDTGCKILNEEVKDNAYTFDENGSLEILYEDRGGWQGKYLVAMTKIDRKPPGYSLYRNPYVMTRDNVEVGVNFTEPVRIIEHTLPVKKLQVTDQKLRFLATENMLGHITVEDLAGNRATVPITITNIDKVKPIGKVTYSTLKVSNQVRAILSVNEEVKLLEGSEMYYDFQDNGSYEFTFEDMAGNRGSILAEVTWIDNKPPEVALSYSTTDLTNKPVKVTLVSTDNEPFEVLNNNGAKTKVFYGTESSYLFKVVDEAGNRANVRANLEHMDVEAPILTLRGDQNIVIGLEEAYLDEGAWAKDNRQGDLTSQIMTKIIGDPEGEVYQISYEVMDQAGNMGQAVRTIRRFEDVPLEIYLDGVKVTGDHYVTAHQKLEVGITGAQGLSRIKWAKGKQNISYFKDKGNRLTVKNLELQPGVYTLFVRDQERKERAVFITISQEKRDKGGEGK